MTFGLRVVIIGNSWSGKSTLVQTLAQRIGAPSIDLDHIHWQDSYGIKRDEDAATRMLADAAAESKWIICREGLSARGLRRGAIEGDHAALLQWAEAYWQRTTPSSFAGHLALFANFARTNSIGVLISTYFLQSRVETSERYLISPRASAPPFASRH